MDSRRLNRRGSRHVCGKVCRCGVTDSTTPVCRLVCGIVSLLIACLVVAGKGFYRYFDRP